MIDIQNFDQDWDFKRLGDLCSIEIGGTPTRSKTEYWATKSDGYPWVSISDIKDKYISNTKEQITKKGILNSNAKLVPRDTLLISFKLTIGKVAITGEPLYTNEAIAAIYPDMNKVTRNWLFHLLPIITRLSVSEQAVKGKTLNKQKLSNLLIPVPSLSIQTQICDIIDTVDDTIQQTEQVIKKLQQIKQGMLDDLLTRGIDENGNLRDPEKHPEQFRETELGRVPKDWGYPQKLKDIVRSPITYGIVQAGPHIPDGVPYIKTGDLAGDRINIQELQRTSHHIAKSYERSKVNYGDIICAIRATVGKVLPITSDLDGANLTQGTARISPSEKLKSSFLLWIMRSNVVQSQISSYLKGTTYREITLAQLREVKIPLPNLKEQEIIGTNLNRFEEYLKIEKMYVDKLRNIKRGLMQDLLTGKVRTIELEELPI